MDATANTTQRALVVSSIFSESDALTQIGQQNYSYHFVYRAFAPLPERWGTTIPITQPESRLDYALWRAHENCLDPLHLSLLPLHLTYLTRRARTIAFPFWEFPDIPNFNIAHNPRNNWVRVAERLALILVASNSTRDAFVRAGVKTPIRMVPVPIRPEYFDVPDWDPDQHVTLDFPGHVLTGAEP